MADSYIDFIEVGEYGDHFVEHSAALVSSKLVQVEELRSWVKEAVAAVDGELAKAGVKRSVVRGGRTDTQAKAERLRKAITQFFYSPPRAPARRPLR